MNFHFLEAQPSTRSQNQSIQINYSGKKMNSYLKLILATAMPLGVFLGTAISASAGQVRIELLDVRCRNTEDVSGADEFYIIGALADGTNTKAALTSPIGINDGQIKSFDPAQQVIFDADVPEEQTVRGGMQAFDEDFGKDWAKHGDTANKITDTVATGLKSSGNPYAVGAGTIIDYAVKGFGFFASLDKDDNLGTLELNVPASGPSVEEKEWTFSKKDWSGYSSWNYTVRYRITRDKVEVPAPDKVEVPAPQLLGKDLYASIFEKSSGPDWVARHGQTSEQYQNTFNDLVSKGYRLVNVSGYNVP